MVLVLWLLFWGIGHWETFRSWDTESTEEQEITEMKEAGMADSDCDALNSVLEQPRVEVQEQSHP
jgi:hypothetical protein